MYAVPDIEDFVAMELCLRKEGSPRAVSADEKRRQVLQGNFAVSLAMKKGKLF